MYGVCHSYRIRMAWTVVKRSNEKKWTRSDSNGGPTGYEPGALPLCHGSIWDAGDSNPALRG